MHSAVYAHSYGVVRIENIQLDSSGRQRGKGGSMKGWFLLHHSPKAYKQILAGFERLSVIHYTPLLTVITKRADSKTSVRINQRPLFPAYLFLYFDPEVVHTTKITQLIGVNEFVKIGGKIRPLPEAVITGLRYLEVAEVDKSDQSVSYSNVPVELLAKLEEINEQSEPVNRMASLISFLDRYVRTAF